MTVYLVGAGPGDPGLLTVRGAEVLRRAEVVVYDRLSVASLLELAPSSAERIGVGKRPGGLSATQDEINALLVERGRAGLEVVRLKGGDPFVFARGGEEAAALAEAGVPFEVVPGITSAVAVPAYAGIPLTLRHSSALFTVITGHEDPTKGGELDWETVARLGGTIVVLMGIGRLPKIVDRLRAGGLPEDTPVAAIQWGTRPEQRTVRATLGTILDHELDPPSTLVIGQVASLNLAWFENRPLFGRSVVVTRPAHQAGTLAAHLESRGARVVRLPVIEIGDPDDGGEALRACAERVGYYDWVVLTSANGANRFLGLIDDARRLGGVKLAAIGPGTADAIRRFNLIADLVPPTYVAEALAEAFPAPGPDDRGRVLLARASVAREVLPEALEAKGWQVEVVDAYRTRCVPLRKEDLDEAAAADAVTFTSSSAVECYRESAGERIPPVVACIGPVTASTAEKLGLRVDVVARQHTTMGLVEALEAHLVRTSVGSRS